MEETKFRVRNGIIMVEGGGIVISDGKGYADHRDFEDGRASNILMQYTGLKDRNGKEIYEGDILQYKAKYPVSHQKKHPHKKYNRIGNGVTYSLKYCSFMLDTTFKGEETFCGFEEHKMWEIIGNIYEDPKLLNN